MYFDWTYIILLPALILAAYAQSKVSSTYSKYDKVRARLRGGARTSKTPSPKSPV